MWLFTTYGFYSVVQDQENRHKLLIRARAKEDIDNLADLGRRVLGADLNVIHTPAADYAFRVWIDRREWAKLAQVLTVESVTYPNFKAEIHGQPDRDSAYMRLWSIMKGWQDDRIFPRRNFRRPADRWLSQRRDNGQLNLFEAAVNDPDFDPPVDRGYCDNCRDGLSQGKYYYQGRWLCPDCYDTYRLTKTDHGAFDCDSCGAVLADGARFYEELWLCPECYSHFKAQETLTENLEEGPCDNCGADLELNGRTYAGAVLCPECYLLFAEPDKAPIPDDPDLPF